MRFFTVRALGVAAVLMVAGACRATQPDPAAPAPDDHPLGGIVGQPLLVAPVQGVRVAPELGWTGLPRNAAITGSLDSAFAEVLRTRVGNLEWVYAAGLLKSFANNPTYATDPRALSVVSLRAAKLPVGDRLMEPLASQVRTMIALHEGRLVLIPVELRFERTPAGQGRSVVRLVLVDPRASIIRWYGDVTGADSPTFTSAYTALIADRVADLFVGK